jgi:hypothetical protein
MPLAWLLESMRFKTYIVAFSLGAILMSAANYYSYVRMGRSMCDDCYFQFGFPFSVWIEGGYVSIRRILWSGLVADVSLAAWAILLLGWGSKKTLFRN